MDKTRKEKMKAKIFKAAVWCFNKKGYDETTLDAIATKAKVSKGGIYYYFKSKKELFLELYHYRVNKYFDQLKNYIKEEKRPEMCLRILVNKSSQILKENEDFFRFCLEFLSMGAREPAIRNEMTKFYKDSIKTFRQLIEEGVTSGRFKDLGSDEVARTIYFLFMGVFFTYFSVNVDFNLTNQVTFHIENILKAIMKDYIQKA